MPDFNALHEPNICFTTPLKTIGTPFYFFVNVLSWKLYEYCLDVVGSIALVQIQLFQPKLVQPNKDQVWLVRLELV